ncbi:MAG: hypothetical protein WCT03_23685 [Candidatus Obscuribacterales bacterium]
MNTCISKVRKYIASLPAGALFSTQSCVQYGTRSAVDQSICELIKQNVIDRIVRGVFVRVNNRKDQYSAEEVARVKTNAFGNEIVEPGSRCAKARGLKDELNFTSSSSSSSSSSPASFSPKGESDEHRFLTSGHTTRFRLGDDYIQLRKCHGRKIELSDSHVGKTIRALWHIKQSALLLETIYREILTFTRNDFIELIAKAGFMPAWLRDRITSAFAMRWQRLAYEVAMEQKRSRLLELPSRQL